MGRTDFGPALGLVVLLALALSVLIWWRILAKTGLSGALGLLMLVPLANLILLLVLAFSEWPVERELRRCREALARPPR